MREGRLAESEVDEAVRRVLRLAARVGVLAGVEPAVTEPPAPIDGEALARELARRSFVLLRNEGDTLPLGPGAVALIGAAARDARILGGGSATVFPAHVVSPLDGLTAALPEGALRYAVGADPATELAFADKGFALRAVCRDASGTVIGARSAPNGQIQWMGSDLPEGVAHDTLHTVELTGVFTPRESGRHTFGTKGTGAFTLTVAGTTYYDDVQLPADDGDPFGGFFGSPEPRAQVELTAGEPVEISLTHVFALPEGAPFKAVAFALVHQEPVRDPDELIAEAVEAARAADTAVVVVATTERVESEGYDRADLRLPGRQDDLVRAVAAANPNTVVVVNAGSPVEMPWREEVAAVLISWFPGQEGGAALADVLTGAHEPGGRLPTTWGSLAAAPVTEVVPTDGALSYREGVFIGYRAWEKEHRTPAYPFGHGLGYTDWSYESADVTGSTVRVRIRNSGERTGREVVQVYLAPAGTAPAPERPARRLAGFAVVEAAPGESAEVAVEIPTRAFEVWDEADHRWSFVKGSYEIQVGRSIADLRITATITV